MTHIEEMEAGEALRPSRENAHSPIREGPASFIYPQDDYF